MDDQTPNPTTRMEPDAAAPAPTTPPPPTTSGWDQPQGRQPRSGSRRFLSLFIGIFLIAIGLWFFFKRTLGFDMPDIQWSQLWPVFLIVLGVVVLYVATRRDRRR